MVLLKRLLRLRPILRRSLHSSKAARSSLIISNEVKSALANGCPTVALESTIITHGMPYPDNLTTARTVESIIRSQGAIPATIAVVKGQVHVGLTDEVLEQLATDKEVVKISRRDFPIVKAKRMSGGTTVAGTMMIAHEAGIPIFVTGGIGGVHRGGEVTMDVSADLTELGRTPVAVVSAGVKSVLDIGRTLEFLETQGVCVATYGDQSEFPSFFSSKSFFNSPWRIPNAQEAARVIEANMETTSPVGILLAVPIPEEHSIDHDLIESVITKAVSECDEKKIIGKDVTPFVLQKINELTGGRSLKANQILVENNAKVGAKIAVELANLKNGGTNRILNAEKRPLVIGGSNFDFVCKVDESLSRNASTVPGSIRTSFGGVARNIADAMTKLGCPPKFITSLGADHLGQAILQNLEDKSCVEIQTQASTSTYCLLLQDDGELNVGIGDMAAHDMITPDVIKNKFGEAIASASLVVLDANFTQETIDAVLEICLEKSVPAFFEPTDPAKAQKLVKSPFAKAVMYSTPNFHELQSMANRNHEEEDFSDVDNLIKECICCGELLLDTVPNLIVTLGDKGVLTLEKGNDAHRVHAKHYPVEPATNVVSVSGAGDCFAAAFITTILNRKSKVEAVEAGLRAANLSLKSSETVPSNLTI